MKPGEILCRRTTGELCIVLTELEAGLYNVRRPVMQEKGIDHVIDEVYAFELETVEEHLRHEAKEMLLKIDIQEEMSQAMENAKKSKIDKLMVN
jgi:hypothetical protein